MRKWSPLGFVLDYVVIAREETHAGLPESNLSAAEGIGSLELFSE